MRKYTLFFLSLNLLSSVIAQEEAISSLEQDSLSTRSYQYLFDRYMEAFRANKFKEAETYYTAHLKKAKRDSNQLKIIDSYYRLYFVKNYKERLAYLDSALISNKTPFQNNYHFFTYCLKGNFYFKNGNYKKALDSYLKAKIYINQYVDRQFINGLESSIGLVRLRIGEFESAKETFTKNYQYLIKNNLQEKLPFIYMNCLQGLSISYWHVRRLDSALYYNKVLAQEAIVFNNPGYFNRSKTTQAIIFHTMEKYQMALDTMNRYLPLAAHKIDSIDLAIGYLYHGKTYSQLNNWEEALKQFKKADTLIQHSRGYVVEMRENYKILYNYYKEKGDLEQSITYLERLNSYGDSLFAYNAGLNNTLLFKDEVPGLTAELETLQLQFKNKNRKKQYIIYILIGVTSMLLLLTSYQYRKRQLFKKRFEKLMTTNPRGSTISLKIKYKKKELDLPQDVVKEILHQLALFETSHAFLDSTMSMSKLAKTFHTNTAYLSKIVNVYKGKNFSTYLADLRIHYIIDALKEQSKLREYTIKAIATEAGFNNTESFNKAFYRQTKLNPSYFIKQLAKRKEIV